MGRLIRMQRTCRTRGMSPVPGTLPFTGANTGVYVETQVHARWLRGSAKGGEEE